MLKSWKDVVPVEGSDYVPPVRRVRNSLNYNYLSERYETNFKPSMTVPDQSMTIREIMSRFASGMPLGAHGMMRDPNAAVYDGDEEFFPNPLTMDISERRTMAMRLREEAKEIKSKFDASQAEKARKEAEKAEKLQSLIDKAEEPPVPPKND